MTWKLINLVNVLIDFNKFGLSTLDVLLLLLCLLCRSGVEATIEVSDHMSPVIF